VIATDKTSAKPLKSQCKRSFGIHVTRCAKFTCNLVKAYIFGMEYIIVERKRIHRMGFKF